jgi:cyclopropane fatty-acyl-phospholipid synthase-like methyltransferase
MSHINTGIRKILEIPAVYNVFQTLHGGNAKRKEHFEKHFSDESIKKVLDIGCGTGVLLEHLNDSIEYHGVDMEESYIQHAQEKYGDRGKFYVQRVGTDVKEEWLNYFDAINAHGLIHHLNDDDIHVLLKGARDYLAPNGKIITIDAVYYDGQSSFSKWIVSKDRGQNVKTKEQYIEIANQYFSRVETELIKDHNRLKYSVLVMMLQK